MSIYNSFKSIIFKQRYYSIAIKLRFILKSNLIDNSEEILNCKKLKEKIYRHDNNLILISNRFNFADARLILNNEDERYRIFFENYIEYSIIFNTLRYEDFVMKIKSYNDYYYIIFENNNIRIISYSGDATILIESNNVSEMIVPSDNEDNFHTKNHIFHFIDDKLVCLEQKVVLYQINKLRSTYYKKYPGEIKFYESGIVKSIKYSNGQVDKFKDKINYKQRYPFKLLIGEDCYDEFPLQYYNYIELVDIKVGELIEDEKEALIECIYDKLRDLNTFQLKKILNKIK